MVNILETKVNWIYPQEVVVPTDFLANSGFTEFIRRSVWSRGITNNDKALRFLDSKKYLPTTPFEFPDMEKASARIEKAIRSGQLIGVWGDFDVDGQTSTSVLVSAFRMRNYPCEYRIPIRATESHGIKFEPLKEFLSRGINLLITCDTGISEVNNIGYAQSCGVDVIVTDHHALPDILPKACAIINPRLLAEKHPLNSLAGVGTAYKLAEALLETSHQHDQVSCLHDLVALGTVADQAYLVDENRYLVQSGINQIRHSPRPSLRALLDFSGASYLQANETQLGYLIAPRLNALGRLSNANPAVEFLLSEKSSEIEKMTLYLEELNYSRKIQCNQVFTGAMAMIEKDRSLIDHPVIVLSHPEWPAGVVGITASRLVELFHKPVIILTQSENGLLKGSARSIEGVDIAAVLKQHENLLNSFGGHPMAAGLSIKSENLHLFNHLVQSTVGNLLETNHLTSELKVDLFAPLSSLTLEIVQNLELLAPFGPGNPSLVLVDRNLSLVEALPIGKNSDHLKITVEDEHANQSTLVWWNGNGFPLPQQHFDLAYSVHATTFKGDEQVQFEWIDYKESSSQKEAITLCLKNKIQNIDLRNSSDSLEQVLLQLKPDNTQIWQEGFSEQVRNGCNRLELQQANYLVIWTAPPNSLILKNVLLKVKPSEIFWVLRKPSERDLTAFLKSLWRLVAVKLDDGGVFERELAYSQLACTDEQLQLGLQWLCATGRINIENNQANSIFVFRGGARDEAQKALMEKTLSKSLAETNAYSSYLRNVDLDQLVAELG